MQGGREGREGRAVWHEEGFGQTPANLWLPQPQPGGALVRRDWDRHQRPPCLPRTQPEPFPVARRHESLAPGTNGCVQGEVRAVGAAQPLPGRGPSAPPLMHWSQSSHTLLAMSMHPEDQSRVLTLTSQVLKDTDWRIRRAWNQPLCYL